MAMPIRPPQYKPSHWRAAPPKKADAYYGGAAWKALREQCLKRDRYACTQCGASGAGVRLIADHIIERKLGGADALHNLRTLCASCDNKRHGMKGYRV
jgi:5-methylcytosine-specific restriction endonuclease McrA